MGRDIQGRAVYSKWGQQGNYSFGQNFVSGMYIVEVIQNDRRQILKLTKK